MTWQPIATAPKDETLIVIYEADREGGLTVARWLDGEWRDRDEFQCEPTHWMPLPEPPPQTKRTDYTSRHAQLTPIATLVAQWEPGVWQTIAHPKDRTLVVALRANTPFSWGRIRVSMETLLREHADLELHGK